MNNELSLYQSALTDFLHAKKDDKLYQYGYCYYFYKKHRINLITDTCFSKTLPVLYSLMPKGAEGTFWFEAGDNESRIELLSKAIKIIKNET